MKIECTVEEFKELLKTTSTNAIADVVEPKIDILICGKKIN